MGPVANISSTFFTTCRRDSARPTPAFCLVIEPVWEFVRGSPLALADSGLTGPGDSRTVTLTATEATVLSDTDQSTVSYTNDPVEIRGFGVSYGAGAPSRRWWRWRTWTWASTRSWRTGRSR